MRSPSSIIAAVVDAAARHDGGRGHRRDNDSRAGLARRNGLCGMAGASALREWTHTGVIASAARPGHSKRPLRSVTTVHASERPAEVDLQMHGGSTGNVAVIIRRYAKPPHNPSLAVGQVRTTAQSPTFPGHIREISSLPVFHRDPTWRTVRNGTTPASKEQVKQPPSRMRPGTGA
jgi:hypothetical protein